MPFKESRCFILFSYVSTTDIKSVKSQQKYLKYIEAWEKLLYAHLKGYSSTSIAES